MVVYIPFLSLSFTTTENKIVEKSTPKFSYFKKKLEKEPKDETVHRRSVQQPNTQEKRRRSGYYYSTRDSNL